MKKNSSQQAQTLNILKANGITEEQFLSQPQLSLNCPFCECQFNTKCCANLLQCNHLICQKCTSISTNKKCKFPKCQKPMLIKKQKYWPFQPQNKKSYNFVIYYICNNKKGSFISNIMESCTIEELIKMDSNATIFLQQMNPKLIKIYFKSNDYQYQQIKDKIIKHFIDLGQINQQCLNEIQIRKVQLGKGGFATFNFNNLNSQKTFKFAQSAPQYRYVFPGLTLLANCQNKQCQAFQKQVCVAKGFGKFNMSKQIFVCCCPICKKQTKQAYNFGYYKTIVKIQGRKVTGQVINIQKTAYTRDFHTYSHSQDETCQWNYLEITTQKLILNDQVYCKK